MKIFARQTIARTLCRTMAVDAIRDGWWLIRMPLDAVRSRRVSGHNPEELKELDLEGLLARWQIPAARLPRIKRVLVLEMAAYAILGCLALANPVYTVFQPEHGAYAALLGLMVGLVAAVQFLQRLHWYMIVAKGRYQRFAEFLRGLFRARG